MFCDKKLCNFLTGISIFDTNVLNKVYNFFNMIRKVFSLLPGMLMAFGFAQAQNGQLPCTTTDMNESYKQSFPEIAKYEEQLKAFIAEGIKNFDVDKARAKGTAFGPDDVLHVPVVVHVVHDYGNVDYVSDNSIYQLLDNINEVFMKENADTSEVIAPFKSYIGNPKVMFHLATKDPSGKPTIGITHRRSYLTAGGDDQAKFDQWDPSSYLNIWIIRAIGRGISNGVVAAYAVFPSSAAGFPYTDGIISSAGSINSNKTIPHEIGHIFNLYHTWGNIQVASSCNGDDEVDDTPPTTGHFGSGTPYGNTANGSCNAASLFDTSCTNNVVSLSKILLDQTLSPKVDSGNKGFDYIPRTNLTLESVKIYPSNIGEEFEITHYKQAAGTNNFNVVNVFGTKNDVIGKTALDAATSTVNMGVDSPARRTSITFNTLKYIWIDSFDIYPSTIGDTFIVNLRKANGDTVKSYVGVTTTKTGAQVVPFKAFIPNANGYYLQIGRNPGLICDSLVTATRSAVDSNMSGVISFTNFVDTVGYDGTASPTAYKGRYNFFYNWRVRYDALTTTDSGAQVVNLGFKVVPDTAFRLTLTKNPGVYNDSIGAAPYVKGVPCVIDILNDTTAGRYDLLYELRIRYGYIKNCIDYPDTVNTQNIMDYADCPRMFTHLQVARMRATLASSVGNRNKLVSDTTHVRTGILNEIGGTYGIRPDLKPIPDFSVERASNSLGAERAYFLCKNSQFVFRQRSWGDTIENVEMSFNKGATTPTVSRNAFGLNQDITNSFSETGWVDITVKATGNNSGDSVTEFKNAVYVADGDTKIDPNNGFYMEFDKNDNNNPLEKWPIFNYYNNDYKWTFAENTGYWDNNCIVYTGFDKRTGPAAYNGTPKGDFDDFFTPAFDLSNMQNICRLNFMYSGAFRTGNSMLMKDTLQISYSTDCGSTWVTMRELTKGEIANKGVVEISYAPLWYGDWDLRSIDVPTAARQSTVFFRFRFKPGADDFTNTVLADRVRPGTGNNFYMDRINISSFPLGVNTLLTDGKNSVLAPNPTTGGSQLIIRSASRDEAKMVVTDVTGKVVYRATQQLNGGVNTLDIPASVIKVKGVYMVHVLAGYERFSEKLVSY